MLAEPVAANRALPPTAHRPSRSHIGACGRHAEDASDICTALGRGATGTNARGSLASSMQQRNLHDAT
eukprot:1538007-Alexandrium_andersonii.AAC.1